MTGFGTARAEDGNRAFTVEARAVNHKFCDVRVRLPRELGPLEGTVQSAVRAVVSRGRVDITVEVSYAPGAAPAPRVNTSLAAAYRDALARINEDLALGDRVTLALVANAPGVLEAPGSLPDLEEAAKVLDRAATQALHGLDAMRTREGASLAADLSRNLDEVSDTLLSVSREVKDAAQQRRARLEQRVREIAGEGVEPARLAQEIVLLAERSDVSEELTRLESHRDQFRGLLASDGPVGRKLDFLLQEMHREANTIGSKSSSARISHLVVDLKATLERMREQVQNVE